MQTYNISNINMKSRNINPFRRYSTHTPKMKNYSEGHFMKKSPLAKDYEEKTIATSITKLFNNIKTYALNILK